MDRADELLKSVTDSPVGQRAAALADEARRHPLVQRLSAHPVFQHPALQRVLQDPKVLAAVAGLLLILLVFACVPSGKKRTKRSGRSGTPTVLLVGPPDSGKTALFAKLSQDEQPATHTSLIPSISTVALPSDDGKSKQVRLVDLAGHARLRDEVTKHIAHADGVVFVVDIVALVRNASSVAEELPGLLTALASAAARDGLSAPPRRLLMLAHKTDLLRPTASMTELPAGSRTTAAERIRSILTREMDRLKNARGGVGGRIEGMGRVASSGQSWWARLFGGAQPEPVVDEDDEALVWGAAGPWRWEDVEGVEIEWGVSGIGAAKAGADAREVANGLDDVNDFLLDV